MQAPVNVFLLAGSKVGGLRGGATGAEATEREVEHK